MPDVFGEGFPDRRVAGTERVEVTESSVMLEEVAEVVRLLFIGSLVADENCEMHPLWDRKSGKLLEDCGDVVMGMGMSEEWSLEDIL